MNSEFWENRIAATNLRPSQTRLPQIPDQTEFLEKWYDFHRGYRVIRKDDNSEERIAVLGEPFRDVSPGHLPRTLDELRAGRSRSEADQQQHVQVQDVPRENGPSLDATLDQLLEEATSEELTSEQTTTEQTTNGQTSTGQTITEQTIPEETHNQPTVALPEARENATRVAGQAMQAANSRNREYQNRRIAGLRRELQRMRSGIERVITGLRELGEFVPQPTEATGGLTNLGMTLDSLEGSSTSDVSQRVFPAPAVGAIYRDGRLTNIQQRLTEAQNQLHQAQRFRDQSSRDLATTQAALEEARRNHEEAVEALGSADLDLSDHRAQASQLRREQRTAENYYRVFGTREEIENQGSEYVSPIGGMFTRAWERFRVAEEVRREERTLRQVVDDEQRAPAHWASSGENDLPENTTLENQLNEYYSMLRRRDWTQVPPQSLTPGQPPRDGPPPTTAGNDTGNTAQPSSRIEHLLRNTAEPERSAIIARMRANGTAQALEEAVSNDFLDYYRRLGAQSALLRARPRRESERSTEHIDRSPPQGLDTADSGRPEAKEDEDMTLKLDCKVCYTQLADTACLPCGHLVMCQWCSEQHSPVMNHDHTRPRSPANCPVCRKRIKQKVRIYRP